MLVVFAVCAVRIVRVVSEFGTTLSICCVCVGSAVAVGVTIVAFNVIWVFVADGELTGTGCSAAFDVRVVIVYASRIISVKILLAVCMSSGMVVCEKANSVSFVNCVQLAFL